MKTVLANLAAKAAMAKVGFVPELLSSKIVKLRGREKSRPYENHIIGVGEMGYILEEHFVTLSGRWR